ncbi:MAG TPA: penicillin acylase family protein [Puia sp.]|jgi:penicillin amidase|nr:penicillin acylase family protein [Puia sp.]
MRIVPFLISLILTIGLIVCLNRQWGVTKTPLLGQFLSPQHGFWQNAEPIGKDFGGDVKLEGMQGKGDVYFDENLIPHVFADSRTDACYIQGYLHARFRLWQMEFQVYAAAGRLSEILGPGADNSILKYDRSMRRLGMVTAARAALAAMESDSSVKADCDAYTAGVNAYISGLKASDLPLEYKLLNYMPEPWTNLKIALFIKYMAYDLAGADNDFELTNARSFFGKDEFARLFPAVQDSVDPIIPKGTLFQPPNVLPKMPRMADSLYLNSTATVTDLELKPEKDNGSNNWAVSGRKTNSGKPILCNDPHLSTNLPAIWYQMQIHTPSYNVYGVSFPGAPYVIIGFNDSCAWGVTNAGRDVRDYYSIRFKDESRREYWFNGAWKDAPQRIDTILVKGREPFYDTVSTTVFGPVMFDPGFTGYSDVSSSHSYAVHWKPADTSDEIRTFSRFQSMHNYSDYKAALNTFRSPGQNFAFADKAGEVALWQQGEFPAKWNEQGLFVMPGEDSSYMWQGNIPEEENPHMVVSEHDRGFVSSANQLPADTSYPYYLGDDYPIYRGLVINRKLNNSNSITAADMMAMQTSNYDIFAAMAKPMLLHNIQDLRLNEKAKNYLGIFSGWDLNDDPDEVAPTIFRYWWAHLEKDIFDDEYSKTSLPMKRPYESTVLEALLRDSTWSFIDNVNTPEKETLRQVVTTAFLQAIPDLEEAASQGRLAWAKNKDTWARHLLRLPALSRMHLPIGGGVHCINAAKQFHGPSWRMVVHLTTPTEAYGIYPGGQSGNPGSPYYDTFIDKWAAGLYNTLWVMSADDVKNQRIRWVLHFSGT